MSVRFVFPGGNDPTGKMKNCMKTENKPKSETISAGETIALNTKFGGLSRGRCWGKFFPNKKTPTGDFEWVEKRGGTLHLSGPGFYIVGSSDGFHREAKSSFVLTEQIEDVANCQQS